MRIADLEAELTMLKTTVEKLDESLEKKDQEFKAALAKLRSQKTRIVWLQKRLEGTEAHMFFWLIFGIKLELKFIFTPLI